MKVKNAPPNKARRFVTLAVLLLSLAMIVLYPPSMAPAQTRQEEVEKRGAKVMPFDLEQTMHVFQKLEDGGLQKVVVKDPANKTQIALIRSHLKKEAEKFRKGDFSDPAKIHGEDMPGLAQLKAGAKKMSISYRALPDGAEIRYRAKDPKLVTAIHQWFDAQLADHGHHAMSHM